MGKEKITKEIREKFKGTETWITNCEGHEIKVTNKTKARLYIDGVEVAKEKGISTSTVLCADIPDTDKCVTALVYVDPKENSVLVKCRIIIGTQTEAVHGFTKKDETFKALTEEEEKIYAEMKKDDEEAALLSALMMVSSSS